MQNSQELIVSGGIVKVSCFLINEEGVRYPDLLNVGCPNHQLLQAWLWLEGETGIPPELAEVHVKGKVLQMANEKHNLILRSAVAFI